MKKLVLALGVAILACNLTACGGDKKDASADDKTGAKQTQVKHEDKLPDTVEACEASLKLKNSILQRARVVERLYPGMKSMVLGLKDDNEKVWKERVKQRFQQAQDAFNATGDEFISKLEVIDEYREIKFQVKPIGELPGFEYVIEIPRDFTDFDDWEATELDNLCAPWNNCDDLRKVRDREEEHLKLLKSEALYQQYIDLK